MRKQYNFLQTPDQLGMALKRHADGNDVLGNRVCVYTTRMKFTPNADVGRHYMETYTSYEARLEREIKISLKR